MTANDPCDWGPIRRAFPLQQVELWEGLVLRPLTAIDLDDLCQFMTGDPEMTWPRVRWNRDNVSYLLNLRLKHYADYGFGPYAVEINGKLVGMAGVQVWAESPCAVEMLAYIDRELWSKKIGTRLLTWVVERARASGGIKELFAATRAENRRAENLSKRIGFREIGRGQHFGHEAIKWKLLL